MNAFKSILSTTLILLSLSVFAQGPGGGQRGGQQGPPPVPNAKQIKKMVADLATEINLTAEQETAVLRLYTEHFEDVKAMTSGSSRPDREKMEALKVNLEKSVKALLNADQNKVYESYLKKQDSQRLRR